MTSHFVTAEQISSTLAKARKNIFEMKVVTISHLIRAQKDSHSGCGTKELI